MRSILGLLAVLAAMLMVPPPAVVRAAPDQPWLADSPTLALTDLGLDPDLLFYGQIGTSSLTVPVPAGMTPSTLNITAELPTYVRSAELGKSPGVVGFEVGDPAEVVPGVSLPVLGWAIA